MTANLQVLNMAGHLIRRLHQQSTQLFSQRTLAAGFEVTPVQFSAMDAIHAEPGIDQAKVAERIGYDRATIGGVIDRLEKRGWVLRIVSSKDRRSRELRLSKAGEQALQQLMVIVKELQKDILHPLSEAEQSFFMHLARRAIQLDSE
jgi:DNA-binding MarR family transcriptional regulator